MSPDPPGRRAAARSRASLLAILAAQAALVVAIGRATPVGEGPDELSHLDYSRYLLRERRLPVASGDPATTLRQAQHPPLYYLLGAIAAAGTDIESLDLPLNPFFSANLEAEHPVPNIHLLPSGARPPPGIGAARRMRLVSLAAGLLVTLATWRLARTLAPGRPHVATAAAAFVAFLPSFAFAAAVFSNDMGANAAAAWTLVLAATIAAGGAGRRTRALAGLTLGAALLMKLTSLPLVAILAVAVVAGRRHDGGRRAGLPTELAEAFVPAALAFGGWPARNVLLLGPGDGLGWRRFLSQASPMARAVPLRDELAVYWRVQWQTLLGRFGWVSVPQPDWVYLGGAAAAALLALGLARSWRRGDGRAITVCLVACSLVYMAVFRLAFSLNLVAAHARYLFGALAPLGVLAALGWDGLWPAPRQRLGSLLLTLIMAAWAVAAAALVIRPAFATPRPLPPPAGEAAPLATFQGGVELVGRPELEPARAGQPARLTLDLRVTRGLLDRRRRDEPGLLLFAQLIDVTGAKAAQADTPPFGGRHPLEAWAPGERHRVTLDLAPGDGRAAGARDLLVGLYPEGDPSARLAAYGPGGEALPESALRITGFVGQGGGGRP